MADKSYDIVEYTNKLASEIIAVVFKSQIDALTETLRQFQVRANTYSILSKKDERICLLYRDGEWLILTSERGQEFDVMHFEDIDDACLALIDELSGSDEEKKQMRSYFLSQLKKTASNKVSSALLFTTLRNSCEALQPQTSSLVASKRTSKVAAQRHAKFKKRNVQLP